MVLGKRLLRNFDLGHDDNALIGSKDDILIPISLDLEPLPLDATGIVCGVAGRLVGRHELARAIEMSYLSTAKAGTVMVSQDDLEEAVLALRMDDAGAIAP